MFSAMHYISYNEALSDGERQGLAEEIKAAAEATTPVNLVAVPHEGGSNDGDVICKLGFKDQA